MMYREEKPRTIDDVIRDTRERLGPPVAYRWRIEEYRPAHTTYGYDGQDHDDELMESTIWFDSEDTVQALLTVTTPSPGNELRLRKQAGYDRIDRIWI